jgi:hypothetical protein
MDAEMVTGIDTKFGFVVTGKTAVTFPGFTCTVAGVEANEGSELEIVTSAPPAPATESSTTRFPNVVVIVPELIVLGTRFSVNDEAAATWGSAFCEMYVVMQVNVQGNSWKSVGMD